MSDKHAYYLANRERILAYQKAYREAHREEISAKNRERYLRRRSDPVELERMRNNHREWSANHPELMKEYWKRDREKNRERRKAYNKSHPEYTKRWREAHPDYMKQWREKRKQKQANDQLLQGA